MILGSHVHFGKEQLLGAAREAISYGANAFMLYTGAPQNTVRKAIEIDYINDAKKIMEENNISIENVICHAPYIINLANKEKIDSWNFSISFLKNEIKRCESLGIKYIVIHPGSSVNLTKEEGINNIIEALNIIITNDTKCMILLETMAGKGSECGRTLEEVKLILDGVNSQNIGVCIDTCHLNDAGYNMAEFDEFLLGFDKIIGINNIKCVHVNDSKNVLGAHKDRHENLGFGTIGFSALLNIINHEKLKNIPKILETPYVSREEGEKQLVFPPYNFEIEMIKKGIFNPNLIEDIREYYK
ncbi:MAG: deoxyribonuclease IV [Firmicutes bacterium]|nr:deoxyribonuclease IV [Bacillota bacterium]